MIMRSWRSVPKSDCCRYKSTVLEDLGSSSMSAADDFRKNAEESRQFAARAIKAEATGAWLKLAEEWLKLAEAVEATATKKREGT
jgi:hypothetical protein